MWSGILGAIITLSTAIFIVMNRNNITPGLAGFVMSYCAEMVTDIAYAITTAADLETAMVAVERVREYIELESENDWTSINAPNTSWPNRGVIEFINLTISYRPDLNPVLKDINLVINSGEKVGIVGRTGSGKSTLMMSLFRIMEAMKGKIIIDGIDISTIGLHELRSKITVIPQEANVFAGTLRLNLDPFNEHSDEELWDAIEASHLKVR